MNLRFVATGGAYPGSGARYAGDDHAGGHGGRHRGAPAVLVRAGGDAVLPLETTSAAPWPPLL